MNSHERVRWWRQQRGLSQAALGKLVGLDQTTICRIETGASAITTDLLETRLVKALKTTMVEFYRVRASGRSRRAA